MSARLAAFCLLNLVVCPAWGSSTHEPETTLVVYLAGSSAPERILIHMRPELNRLMREAGYRIQWTDPRANELTSTDALLAVVELRGTCEAGGPAAATRAPLATTATSGGQIIPFSAVDCATLNRLVSAPLAGEPAARRDFLYARAMARLIAHELYHIILCTRDHGAAGISRPAFSASDLLTDRFDFEPATLAKLRPASELEP
jgi:hypothetical protein